MSPQAAARMESKKRAMLCLAAHRVQRRTKLCLQRGIKAEAALDIIGGTVTVDSADDSLHSNDSMIVSGGGITVKSGDDGLHADNTLTIEDGHHRGGRVL